MDENLKRACEKMGMSDCPTGLMMSVDLLLEISPKELENVKKSFPNLNDAEVKAFNDYVESRRKK